MNALDHVERRDSGTPSQDRASAAYFNDYSVQEARQTHQVNAACVAIR